MRAQRRVDILRMSTTAASPLVGGRYEILRTLGQGAFGRTFLARDREQDRTVAIKLLDTRGRDDWKAYELFKREAEVLRCAYATTGSRRSTRPFRTSGTARPRRFSSWSTSRGPRSSR